MKVTNESQLLDQSIRKQLIDGWKEGKNVTRKAQAYKAYRCLKDHTIDYVIELLLAQFDPETVYEMQYAASNVSILRKVIQKLAKVYSNGVIREMPTDAETLNVNDAAKYLQMTEKMKKANTYFRTFKNTLAYVKPIINENGSYEINLEIKAPYLYDVVENPNDPTQALAYVLSDYEPTLPPMYAIGDAAHAGRSGTVVRPVRVSNESKEQDTQYIWWSKNFHFTTNANGEIISGENIENPIGERPFVNLVDEQDDCFFAEGGDDLIESGVKINVALTNMEHIGTVQGYGQLYMTGSNLPKSVKTGPNVCVQLEVPPEATVKPDIGFLNANPQLAELRANVEMMMALMLTTNNLSTSGFSTSLKGSRDFASGIALMIDKAESVEDVQEQSAVFAEAEPQVFHLAQRWQEVLQAAGVLSEAARAFVIPKNVGTDLVIDFPSPKPVMSENELLDVYQKRLDMGLSSRVDILMRDNPSLTHEQAEEKLQKIDAEKVDRMNTFIGGSNDQGDENGSDGERDELNAGSVGSRAEPEAEDEAEA